MEELKEGWRRVKLGEVAEILNGYAFKANDFKETGIPVIKIKNITPPKVKLEDVQFVSEEIYNEKIKYSLIYNDILISMTGSHASQPNSVVGRVARIKEMNRKILLNQRVGKIYPKNEECNQSFLYYYLSQDFIKFELAASAGGSASQANINPNQIKNLEISLPLLKTQEKIASILSALDDKIEINNEMNKTLEEMAQTLFKRWFIDFDFPNENGEPYKSSGGKMVDSELGEIPEGWEIGKIGDLIRVQNGYAFKSKAFLEKGTVGIIKIKNISDRKVDINKTDFISEELAKAIDKKFFIQSSSILIAMTGAEVGKIGIVPEHHKKLYLNQRVGKFEELINGGKEFAYFYLNKEETQELMIAKSAGSAQPNISSKGIEELKIVLPSIKLLSEFEKNIGKSLKKIALNLNEINTLTEIRDTLLPKLMSGEVEV